MCGWTAASSWPPESSEYVSGGKSNSISKVISSLIWLFFPLLFLEAHLNCPCLSKLLQSSLAYAVATSLNNDAQLRCLAMSSDNALCSSCGRKPLILKKSHSPRPLQHIIRWPLGISRMRYQNWDVLVFPDQCKIPLQEFKTACQVIQDPGEYHIYPAFLY